MKFLLEIDCDNAAFEGQACTEVGRILRETADRMEWGATESFPLLDINGNTVGRARFVVEG